MRFAIVFCLAFATAIVESRPSTLPADFSKLDIEQSIGNLVGARGLGDALHNALDRHSNSSNGINAASASSSTTSSDASTSTMVTTSSSSASATSLISSSAPISSTSNTGTTTSASATQTSSPSSSTASSSTMSNSLSEESPTSSPSFLGSLLSGGTKHQDPEDTKTEVYGDDKITTYHSLGTTEDRVGFSWVPVDSSD